MRQRLCSKFLGLHVWQSCLRKGSSSLLLVWQHFSLDTGIRGRTAGSGNGGDGSNGHSTLDTVVDAARRRLEDDGHSTSRAPLLARRGPEPSSVHLLPDRKSIYCARRPTWSQVARLTRGWFPSDRPQYRTFKRVSTGWTTRAISH